MNIPNDKLDLLQNLEFSVVTVWRAHPELTDYAALRAYEAVRQLYRAELRGHVPKPHGLTGLEATAFDALKTMCEFRLGRGTLPGLNEPPPQPPVALELLVDCLRELEKYVERHTKAAGKQGYLTFIDGFLP
jgi:hypothetical protein